LKMVRHALRRHGDYVRIADGLIATDKPGMGNLPRVRLKGEMLVEHLLGVLVRWHSLKTPTRWNDKFASRMWNKFIEPLLAGIDLPASTEEMTGPQRKAVQETLRIALKPVARKLAAGDRTKVSIAWATEW